MIRTHGFTLIEVLIALAILGIVASLAIPSYSEYVDRARNADAMSDIAEIQSAIERFYVANERLPNNLAEAGFGAKQDPWERNYFYRVPTTRFDQNNLPINTDYDLYSSGKNKRSRSRLTSSAGKDDIVRGRNGNFIGLAEDY